MPFVCNIIFASSGVGIRDILCRSVSKPCRVSEVCRRQKRATFVSKVCPGKRAGVWANDDPANRDRLRKVADVSGVPN